MPAPALRQGPDAARTRVLKRAFVYCVWLCGFGAVCSLRCVYVGRRMVESGMWKRDWWLGDVVTRWCGSVFGVLQRVFGEK